MKTSSGASYAVGFVSSLLLTIAAFLVVALGIAGASWIITAFALLQTAVQLVLFLHLGLEAKPRWHLMTFLFMAAILIILFFGSLWIMSNLNYRL